MSAQETSLQDTSDQETSDQETSDQETSLQETSDQETADQAASDQDTSSQETASQLREALAASSQETSSKTTPSSSASFTRKASSARFGFGGDETSAAPGAETSPTPPALFRTLRNGSAFSISAPFTWSGVRFGLTVSSAAAMPETIGAEREVPESVMYVPLGARRTCFGFSVVSVEPAGTGPVIARPGALSSGFANPSGV